MRAHEFILLEYNRDSTINSLGTKILKTYYSSKYGNRVPEYLLTDPSVRKKVLGEIFNVLESFKVPYVPDNYFTVWLAREYGNGNLFKNVGNGISGSNDMNYLKGNLDVLKPYLEAYYKYKNKSWFPRELKDLMNLDRDTFVNSMRNLKVPEEVTKDRGQSLTVLNNSVVRVLRLLDKQAAIYYGQGTHPRWCTSYTTSDNKFHMYAARGQLYVILPKKPDRKNEKYQFFFSNIGNNSDDLSDDEYTDETNTAINPYNTAEKFGEEFREWLYSIRPQYSESLMFQDNEKISRLWDALTNYLKPQFEHYSKEMLTNPGYNYYTLDARKSMAKTAMGIWEELSRLKGDKIKEICLQEYMWENSYLYKMEDMFKVWDLIYDKVNDELYKSVKLPLEYVLEKTPAIEKVGSNHYSKNDQTFIKDLKVDGYYIGTVED